MSIFVYNKLMKNNEKIFRREKYLAKIRPFYDAFDIIKVITGVRRCGKSTIMKMIMDELIESGVENEAVKYINLDSLDYRNIKTSNNLEQLIAKIISTDKNYYLLIDEIQNVQDFESVINAFREMGNVSIFVTGSNSYLLSGELITKLTGRYLEFEIYTLTFDEYLEMKKQMNLATDSDIHKELISYLTQGGFPRAVFFNDNEAARTYVEGIVSEIFEKDIAQRVRVNNKKTFQIVQNFIINNYASPMSIRSIHEALLKAGNNISRSTIARYIEILENAKIIYECDRFDMKSKKSLSGEKKFYLADLAFYYARNADTRPNIGPSLENLVYIFLKSKNYSVSVGRIGRCECDFIVRTPKSNYAYIQVCYMLADDAIVEREFRPLQRIQDNYGKYVISCDSYNFSQQGIRHINFNDLFCGKIDLE